MSRWTTTPPPATLAGLDRAMAIHVADRAVLTAARILAGRLETLGGPLSAPGVALVAAVRHLDELQGGTRGHVAGHQPTAADR